MAAAGVPTAAAVAVLETGLARLDGDPGRADAGFDLMMPLADLLVQAGDAARGKDFPMLEAGILTVGAIFVATTLVADTLYTVLNPRLREAGR